MADFLGTLTDLGGANGGDTGGSTGSGNGGSSSSFDLSKVLNVDNNSSFDQTHYTDHQSSSQNASTVDNGSESSTSYEQTSHGGDGGSGSSSTSYEDSHHDLGGSQSDSSDASHNVDYSSTSFTNDFSLDSSLDQLSQTQQHDGGGLLGHG